MGIILTPKEATTFTYANSGWKDQLIAVNNVELTYDEVGNVLTYGDKEFTWNTGRNLESIVDGDNQYSYTYDENGIRTSKTVNGVTTYYNTNDGVILSQTDGTNTMYFQYDTNGAPLGFIYNGTQYLYITNQMGDVIAITDAIGNVMSTYSYDAWGSILAITGSNTDIANTNPIRYRGYYYDNETAYYYLQSRYYDSNICRFINSDIPEIAKIAKNTTAGNNLFAYCNNNPVNNRDTDGRLVISTRIKIAIIAGLAYGIYNTGFWYTKYSSSKKFWISFGWRFVKGFIRGFSAVYFFGKNKTTLAAIAIGIVKVIDGMLEGDVCSAKTALKAFITGYTTVTSVALGAKLLKKIPNPKIKGAAQSIWEALF